MAAKPEIGRPAPMLAVGAPLWMVVLLKEELRPVQAGTKLNVGVRLRCAEAITGTRGQVGQHTLCAQYTRVWVSTGVMKDVVLLATAVPPVRTVYQSEGLWEVSVAVWPMHTSSPVASKELMMS